jgi:hypothetical protein
MLWPRNSEPRIKQIIDRLQQKTLHPVTISRVVTAASMQNTALSEATLCG